jgi:hypothetical protein
MKKLIIGLTILAFFTLAIQAQKVNNYTYKLDNGIVVKMEKEMSGFSKPRLHLKLMMISIPWMWL